MTPHPATAASNRRAVMPAVPLCSLPIDQRTDLFLWGSVQFATPTVQILVRRPSKSVRATKHLFASGASVYQLYCFQDLSGPLGAVSLLHMQRIRCGSALHMQCMCSAYAMLMQCIRKQPGATKSRQESSQEQPAAASSSQEQPVAARSSQEQPGPEEQE